MSSVFIDASGNLKYQGTTGNPAVLSDSAGVTPLVPQVVPFTGSTGSQSVGTSSFQSIGTIAFNPSAIFAGNDRLTRTITFQAIVEATPSVTLEIRLYNLNAGAVVTGSLLSSSSNSPVVVSGTLTVGAATNLLNSEQIYEVQLRISAPGSPAASDRAICKSAQIVVTCA